MSMYLIQYPKSVEEDFTKYNVPLRLRRTAVTICERFIIDGLCDPMYICNIIAEMSGHGDGNGNFDHNFNIDKCSEIAERIQSAYGCNIFCEDLPELEEILRSEGGWDIPTATRGINKLIKKLMVENRLTADEWRKKFNRVTIERAKIVLDDLNTKYRKSPATWIPPVGYRWEWNGRSDPSKERSRLVKISRYIAVKRTALDGKTWWVIWDKENHCYSTRADHGMYKRKKDAEYRINNPAY